MGHTISFGNDNTCVSQKVGGAAASLYQELDAAHGNTPVLSVPHALACGEVQPGGSFVLEQAAPRLDVHLLRQHRTDLPQELPVTQKFASYYD